MVMQTLDEPIRAAVFHQVEHAARAVDELAEHGFTAEQITVVCSDREVERQFRRFEHQEPAGYYSRSAVVGGAVFGASFGIVIAIVMAIVAEAGAFVLGLMMLCGMTGAVFGGFLGEMMTRGLERELANFYDQEVQPGDILVAAEDHGERAVQHLEEAEYVFEHAGVKPIKLCEG